MEGQIFLNTARSGAKALGTAFDFDFRSSRLFQGSSRASIGDISADFTRASSAYGKLSGGNYDEFGIDEPRVILGVGYQNEEAATGFTDPIGMSISDPSGVIKSTYGGTHLGVFNDAITLASGGQTYHRSRLFLPDLLSGENRAFQIIMRKGTSQNYRASVQSETLGIIRYSTLNGTFANGPSNTSVTFTDHGDAQDIELIDLGNDYFMHRFLFTATKDCTGCNIGVGPHSDVIGENIHWIGCDVKDAEFFTSFSDGARAADRFLVSASENGMSFPEGAVFWKGRINAQSLSSAKRVFMLGASHSNSIYCQQSSGSGSLRVQTRSGGVTQILESTSVSLDYFTAGITWRSDGSTRLQITGEPPIDGTSYVPPVADADLYIGSSQSTSEASNSTTERLVGFSQGLTNTEFDQIFAEIEND